MRAVLLVASFVLALVLVGTPASAPAVADWRSGHALKKACHGELAFDSGECLGFTSAVADLADAETISGWHACIPAEVTRGQLRDIVVKFLDDHPEKLHLAATSLASRAFAEAFPCPK